MTNKLIARAVRFAFLCGVILTVGCESPGWVRSLKESFSMSGDAEYRLEEKHRREYQANHDKSSLRWLLAHRIDTGMSYGEVCQVLGEDGEQEHVDRWLKTKGSTYRLDDVIYRFGPDNEGHSYYLGFREDKLINYDREHFRDSGPPTRSGKPKEKSAADLIGEEP